MEEPPITPELIEAHGLTPEEYEIIKRIGEEKYYKWFECLKELLDFLVEIKKEELDIVRSEISAPRRQEEQGPF